MARELEQHVIDQIRRLGRQNKSIREIAQISGKSTNTVMKYLHFTPPATPTKTAAVPGVATGKKGEKQTKVAK